MKTAWMYKMDACSFKLRFFMFIFCLASFYVAWYFLLEKPLVQAYQASILRAAQAKSTQQEINFFLQHQDTIVYQNNVSRFSLSEVLQQTLAKVPEVKLLNQPRPSSISLALAVSWTGLANLLHIVLSDRLRESSVTWELSGRFDDFMQFMQVLEADHKTLYVDSVRFNMYRYPIAHITINVFQLEG